MSKPAIIFPAIQGKVSQEIHFSRQEIRSLCEFRPISAMVGSIGNYVAERHRTGQKRKQYEAMKEAVDAEYSELENQAYIHFQELTKQLEEEFKLKHKLLDMELQKAEQEADRAFQENQVAFEKYVRTSVLYREIFNQLAESAVKLGQLIQFAKQEEIAVNTRYYIELSEKYRLIMNQIDKFHKIINLEEGDC